MFFAYQLFFSKVYFAELQWFFLNLNCKFLFSYQIWWKNCSYHKCYSIKYQSFLKLFEAKLLSFQHCSNESKKYFSETFLLSIYVSSSINFHWRELRKFNYRLVITFLSINKLINQIRQMTFFLFFSFSFRDWHFYTNNVYWRNC